MDPTACPQFGQGIAYIGEWDNFGRPNGEGQIVFADGSEYKGAFKAGKRDRFGRYRYGKDGPIYEGERNSDKLCEFSMEEHFKKSSEEGKVDSKMEENQFTNKSGEDKEEIEGNSYTTKERIIKEEEEIFYFGTGRVECT